MKTSFAALCGSIICLIAFSSNAQAMVSHNAIEPEVQYQRLILPATHNFKEHIKNGDLLSAVITLGNDLVVTGYISIYGRESSPDKVDTMTAMLNGRLNKADHR